MMFSYSCRSLLPYPSPKKLTTQGFTVLAGCLLWNPDDSPVLDSPRSGPLPDLYHTGKWARLRQENPSKRIKRVGKALTPSLPARTTPTNLHTQGCKKSGIWAFWATTQGAVPSSQSSCHPLMEFDKLQQVELDWHTCALLHG